MAFVSHVERLNKCKGGKTKLIFFDGLKDIRLK